MRPFRWTKAHAVFIPRVDAEHRDLFRMADEIDNAIGKAKPAEIQARLEGLFAALDQHFTGEERIMRGAGAESYAWHKQQHDTARKRGKELLADSTAGEARAAEQFLQFLSQWFRDHIAISDRMMSAQVRNSDRRYLSAS